MRLPATTLLDVAPRPDLHTHVTLPSLEISARFDIRASIWGDPLEAAEPVATLPASALELEARLLRALEQRKLPEALMVASSLVYLHPGHDVARRLKERCADQLESKGAPDFAPRHAIPCMRLSWDALRDRTLSREAAYVLSCVDGASTIEALIDMSALQPLAAYEALDALICDGIVGVGR